MATSITLSRLRCLGDVSVSSGSVDANKYLLLDSNGLIDTSFIPGGGGGTPHTLVDNSSIVGASAITRTLTGAGGSGDVAVDWSNRVLKGTTNNTTLDWYDLLAYDGGGGESIDWDNRLLVSEDTHPSISWDSRQLIDGNSAVVMSWSSTGLLGSNWSIDQYGGASFVNGMFTALAEDNPTVTAPTNYGVFKVVGSGGIGSESSIAIYPEGLSTSAAGYWVIGTNVGNDSGNQNFNFWNGDNNVIFTVDQSGGIHPSNGLYGGGNQIMDGAGQLYYTNSNLLADNSGNLYSNLTGGLIMMSGGAGSSIIGVSASGSSGTLLMTDGDASGVSGVLHGWPSDSSHIILGDGSTASIDSSVTAALTNALNGSGSILAGGGDGSTLINVNAVNAVKAASTNTGSFYGFFTYGVNDIDSSVTTAWANPTNGAGGLVSIDGSGHIIYPGSSSPLVDTGGNLYYNYYSATLIDSFNNLYLPWSASGGLLYDSTQSAGTAGQFLIVNASTGQPTWESVFDSSTLSAGANPVDATNGLLSFDGIGTVTEAWSATLDNFVAQISYCTGINPPDNNAYILSAGTIGLSLILVGAGVSSALTVATNAASGLVALDASQNLNYPSTTNLLVDPSGNLYSNLTVGDVLVSGGTDSPITGLTTSGTSGTLLMTDGDGSSITNVNANTAVIAATADAVAFSGITSWPGSGGAFVMDSGAQLPVPVGVQDAMEVALNAPNGLVGLDSNGLFYPIQATTVGAPPYTLGALYFDTTLNKLRVGGATAWETVTSV